MSLTDVAIRKAKAGEKTTQPTDERGLYLEIPPGGGKGWRLRHWFSSKEKRRSLGSHPDVGLKEAREWLVKSCPTCAGHHGDRTLRRFVRGFFSWIGTRPIAGITAQESLIVV